MHWCVPKDAHLVPYFAGLSCTTIPEVCVLKFVFGVTYDRLLIISSGMNRLRKLPKLLAMFAILST